MKKTYILLISSLLLVSFMLPRDIYSISLTTINGETVTLDGFKGRKMLFVILPVTSSDSSAITELLAFKNKYGNRVQVIGIFSREDGFEDAKKSEVKNMYRTVDSSAIILTDGMHVRRNEIQQSALMRWLTNKENNRHFNEDCKGVGHKFFVDETGRLFAVVGPRLPLNAPLIDKIMNTTPSTAQDSQQK